MRAVRVWKNGAKIEAFENDTEFKVGLVAQKQPSTEHPLAKNFLYLSFLIARLKVLQRADVVAVKHHEIVLAFHEVFRESNHAIAAGIDLGDGA